jgi:hypothetical protein
MALNSYFSQGTQAERDLYEDLVIEQIKIYGQDLKYIPRTLVNRDELFGEDVSSKFENAYTVEMYIANVEGFEGDGDLYSKFGIRVTDQATFIVSRKRWTEEVDDNATLIREGRPNEGDLIYFPLTKKLFEIKFVEYKKPFYQLKNPYGAFVYELRCELFEYSDEQLNTGDTEIDAIESKFSTTITLTLADGGTGDFDEGEIIVGSTSNTEATVKSWDSVNKKLYVYDRTGTFAAEVITGQGSNASWTIATYNTLNNVNSAWDQNDYYETEADSIIDWTETNPFGEFGNLGASK